MDLTPVLGPELTLRHVHPRKNYSPYKNYLSTTYSLAAFTSQKSTFPAII
jgi:hypothetical protein